MSIITEPERVKLESTYNDLEKPLIAFKNNVINEGLTLNHSIRDNSILEVNISSGKIVIGKRYLTISNNNIVDISLDSISSRNPIAVLAFYVDCQQVNVSQGNFFGFRIGSISNQTLIPII